MVIKLYYIFYKMFKRNFAHVPSVTLSNLKISTLVCRRYGNLAQVNAVSVISCVRGSSEHSKPRAARQFQRSTAEPSPLQCIPGQGRRHVKTLADFQSFAITKAQVPRYHYYLSFHKEKIKINLVLGLKNRTENVCYTPLKVDNLKNYITS